MVIHATMGGALRYLLVTAAVTKEWFHVIGTVNPQV
jgi:hypothetical protein